jgi:DNA topoisomerase-6 subunit A
LKGEPGTSVVKRHKVIKLLMELGERICDQIERGEYPWLELPNRSVKNIVYDERLRQYVLGPMKTVRTSRNVKHLRPLAQLLWLAYFSKTLL